MFRPVNRRNRGSPDIRNNMNICLWEIFQQLGGGRPASEKTKFRCTVSQKEIRCPDSFCVFRARIVASFVRIHFIRRSNDSVLIEQHQSSSRVHHYEKRQKPRGKTSIKHGFTGRNSSRRVARVVLAVRRLRRGRPLSTSSATPCYGRAPA